MRSRPEALPVVLTPDATLQHWQGHRRLTRRVIEAFPPDRLFEFSLGGMRPFGVMALELLGLALPMVRQLVEGGGAAPPDRDVRWTEEVTGAPDAVRELLRRWDEATVQIEELWPQIPPGRFQETIKVFGQWEGRAGDLLFYVIDNEIHHRGQGYVYLRALGVEPPRFWERG